VPLYILESQKCPLAQEKVKGNSSS
jgi:hypothetical protein